MVVAAVGVVGVIAVVAVIVVAGPVVVVVVVLVVVVAVVVHGIGRVEVVLLGLVLVFLAAFCLGSVVALGVKNIVNTNVLNGSEAKKYGIYGGF